MSMETLTMFSLTLQIAVTGILVALMARMLTRDRFSMMGAFFAFGITGILLSDLYWLAYTVLEPEARMPFAVNEIGECAAFLLLGAAMRTELSDAPRFSLRESLAPMLFVACNTALWIAWSGEWVQDILSGLTLCYYHVVAARFIRQEGAFSRPERVGIRVVASLLVILQALTFFAPAGALPVLDACVTALIAGSIVLFGWKIARALRAGDPAALALAFGGFGWLIICLYMSAGMLYFLLSLCIILSLLMMFEAVRKRVSDA